MTMDVLKAFNNGFGELVCVTPPGCELSPLSSIRPEDCGKAPGLRKANGQWTGYQWRSGKPLRSQMEFWVSWNSNIGLRSSRFPGIDIDVLDEVLAGEIENLALRILGDAPRRVGLPPKRLLIYTTESPFPKRTLKFENDAKQEFLVEVLAEGQQYVVSGIHPTTGKPYTCEPGLDTFISDELSLIDEKQLEGFLDELRSFLSKKNYRSRISISSGGERDLIDQESLKGDPEMVAEAVALIPNDTTYDEWVRIGHAIKAALAGEEDLALELWIQFSQRWSQGNTDQDFIEDKFRGFKPPYSIGADWIYQQARGHGLNTAAADFSPVEELVSETEKNLAPVMYSEMALKWRVVKRHRSNFRYMPEKGKFLFWDSYRWRFDDRGLIPSEVGRICSEASAEALMKIEDKRSAERTATRLAGGRTVREVIGLLKPEQGLILTAAEADQNPWLLNTPAGTVDLKTGTLRRHDPEDLISKSTAVGPEKMECPIWKRFLAEATQDDGELIAYLQRLCGYALTGSTSEQMLAFVWGPGGNGKGVFLNTVTEILGEYATTAGSEVFLASRYERHPTELAGLQGARLVVSSEIDESSRWNESRIKSLTGGDPITARFMRQDFFTFTPQFTLVISGNHKPQLRNITDAIRRRFHLVPFTFKPKVIDPELKDRIKKEWPEILDWMIEGCISWQHEGLNPPPVVLDATREYFQQEDRLGNWIEECCAENPEQFTATGDLFNSWSGWCLKNNEFTDTKNSFSKRLAERGFRRGQHTDSESRSRGFYGLIVIEDYHNAGSENQP